MLIKLTKFVKLENVKSVTYTCILNHLFLIAGACKRCYCPRSILVAAILSGKGSL